MESIKNNTVDIKNNLTIKGGAPLNPSQIDIGNYVIYAGEEEVGQVFVALEPTSTGDLTRTIEHWCLYSNYKTPSEHQRSVALRFDYVPGGHASVTDFLAYARTKMGARYIQAVCTEMAP